MSTTSGALTLRERRQALTRRDIIRAGEKVFSRRGYQAATVDEIAKAAGVSRATFYLYFPSKADLSMEIGTQGVPAMRESMSELAGFGAPTLADLRAWVEGFAQHWARNRNANSLGLRGSMADAGFEETDEGITSGLLDLISPIVDRYPPESRGDARARFRVLVLQLSFTMFELHERGSRLDRSEILDALAVMWFRELQEAWLHTPEPG